MFVWGKREKFTDARNASGRYIENVNFKKMQMVIAGRDGSVKGAS